VILDSDVKKGKLMKALIIFILMTAFGSILSANPLNKYAGSYELTSLSSSQCPQNINVSVEELHNWTPAYFNLRIGAVMEFGIPAHPSFGYPTPQSGDTFGQSYGPQIENPNGLTCTETADFSNVRTLTVSRACLESEYNLSCIYRR
jgi:hypothetical protein